jgi:hypothetical protein
MFKDLLGDTAVLRKNGVFFVVPLYTYQDGLYAKVGGGFIRLRDDMTTSQPGTQIESVQTDKDLYRDQFGRISLVATAKTTPLAANAARLLLRGE